MNELQKTLDQVFATLCGISVSGADVERMVMAKTLVRKARELVGAESGGDEKQ